YGERLAGRAESVERVDVEMAKKRLLGPIFGPAPGVGATDACRFRDPRRLRKIQRIAEIRGDDDLRGPQAEDLAPERKQDLLLRFLVELGRHELAGRDVG